MGHSTHQIAHSTGLSQSTISRLHSKHCQYLPKLSGGHQSIITPTDMHHAICLIGNGKAKNAVQVTKTLQYIKNHSISPQTVCCHLRKAGMKAVVKQECPLLSKHHRREWLDFALSHEDWTVEDWKHVIWLDGRKLAWKRAGEGLSYRLVEGTVKFGGGSIMLWGCMTWEGVGFPCIIEGKMDADLYVLILEEELQQTLGFFDKSQEDIIFQQMIPSIQAERPRSGLKTMNLRSWYGLLNLQTSTL